MWRWRRNAKRRHKIRRALTLLFGDLVRRAGAPATAIGRARLTASPWRVVYDAHSPQLPVIAKRDAFWRWRFVVGRMTSKLPHRQVYGSLWHGTSLWWAFHNRPVRKAWRKWLDFVTMCRQRDVRCSADRVPRVVAPHSRVDVFGAQEEARLARLEVLRRAIRTAMWARVRVRMWARWRRFVRLSRRLERMRGRWVAWSCLRLDTCAPCSCLTRRRWYRAVLPNREEVVVVGKKGGGVQRLPPTCACVEHLRASGYGLHVYADEEDMRHFPILHDDGAAGGDGAGDDGAGIGAGAGAGGPRVSWAAPGSTLGTNGPLRRPKRERRAWKPPPQRQRHRSVKLGVDNDDAGSVGKAATVGAAPASRGSGRAHGAGRLVATSGGAGARRFGSDGAGDGGGAGGVNESSASATARRRHKHWGEYRRRVDPRCGLKHHAQRRLLGMRDVMHELHVEQSQIERDAAKR